MAKRSRVASGVILSVGLWEAVAWWMDEEFFLSLMTIATRLLELFGDEGFRHDLYASLARTAAGTSIGTLLAAGVAAAVVIKPSIRDFLSGPLYFLFPIPKVALFPFFLLIFGLGWKSQTALIAMGVFFLVYINLQAGMQRLLRSNLRDALIAQGVSVGRSFYPYFVKGCIPDLLTGLRSGIGYGLTLMVVSEISGSRDGLGHFIWRSWDLFRIADLYCGVFVIGLVGVSINLLLDAIYEALLPRYSLTG